MRNSKKEFKRVDHANISIPDAPTYHPTIEEFRNPLEYINKYVIPKIRLNESNNFFAICISTLSLISSIDVSTHITE
jgi:hypothetical protein